MIFDAVGSGRGDNPIGSSSRHLVCAEIAAGNERTASLLELPGFAAWVHSVPVGAVDAGGDVHYVSLCPSCIVSRIAFADVSGHGQPRPEHQMRTPTVHATRGCGGASRIAWRSLLATVGSAFALVLLAAPCYAQAATTAVAETSVSGLPSAERGEATEHSGNAIRPFRINVPEEALLDLRRRVVATRWPNRETVTDQCQGVQLAKIRPLIQYWGTGYDWRKAELFVTEDRAAFRSLR